jgi:hypothetical protein
LPLIAIVPLVQLLHDATPAAAASAVAAAPEAHTYRWRVAPGTAPLEWAREEAARALHALACGCPPNQSAIAEAGGIAATRPVQKMESQNEAVS